MCYIARWMRSKSGRIVLEIDPALKHRLHARLASDGRTLKEWFLERAEAYLADAEAVQLELPVRRRGQRGRVS